MLGDCLIGHVLPVGEIHDCSLPDTQALHGGPYFRMRLRLEDRTRCMQRVRFPIPATGLAAQVVAGLVRHRLKQIALEADDRGGLPAKDPDESGSHHVVGLVRADENRGESDQSGSMVSISIGDQRLTLGVRGGSAFGRSSIRHRARWVPLTAGFQLAVVVVFRLSVGTDGR
jgi:hypothetical protein